MFCTKCGNVLNDGDEFCGFCGAKTYNSKDDTPSSLYYQQTGITTPYINGLEESNKKRLSSGKIVAIALAGLAAVTIVVLAIIFVPKIFDKKENSSSATGIAESVNNESVSPKPENVTDNKAEIILNDNNVPDTNEENGVPINEPAFYENDRMTELGQLICTMVENNIVTEERNLINNHDWSTVIRFLQISDSVTGVGHLIADDITCDTEKSQDVYYYSRDALEKLAYTVLGEELKADDLHEVAASFGEWATTPSEYAPNGLVYVDNDRLAVVVGAAGYMGPEAMHYRRENLGDGKWRIIVNIAEEDLYTYDYNVVPLVWQGILVVTVEEDDKAISGYRIIDTEWAPVGDKRYVSDWEKVYFDKIQSIYTTEREFSMDVPVTFDFVYFNDDNIFDLVVNYLGYSVSVYCYDGKSAREVFSGGYGAAGLNAYGYLTQEGLVTWGDIDYAGLEINYEAFKLNEYLELVPLLEHSLHVKRYKDMNNNNMPDDFEVEDSDLDEEYYYVDGQEVSEEEFDRYIRMIPETDGELTDEGLSYYEALEKLFSLGYWNR